MGAIQLKNKKSTATGSLGQGLSIGVGIALNAKAGFTKNLEGIGEVIYNPKQINLISFIEAVNPYQNINIRN